MTLIGVIYTLQIRVVYVLAVFNPKQFQTFRCVSTIEFPLRRYAEEITSRFLHTPRDQIEFQMKRSFHLALNNGRVTVRECELPSKGDNFHHENDN